MADGSLIFDTKIDSENFNKDTQKVGKSLDKVYSSLEKSYARADKKLSATVSKLDEVQSKMLQIQSEAEKQYNGLPGNNEQLVDNLLASNKEYQKLIDKNIALDNAYKEQKGELSSIKLKMSEASSEMQKQSTLSARLKSGFEDIGKSVAKMAKRMVLLMAIRQIISWIKEGTENLAQFDAKTNKSISNIQSSFEAMKNSLATAFAPILQAITPIIMGIVDAFTWLINQLTKVITLLFTTNTTFIQAKKATKDYASTLKGTNKELKKTTASFDELNILTVSTNESLNDTDPKNMFEEVSFSGPFAEFQNMKSELFGTVLETLTLCLEKLKPLGEWFWNNFLLPISQWKGGIFTTVLEAINSGLEKLNDWLGGEINFEEFIDSLSTGEIIALAFAIAIGLVVAGFLIYNIIIGIATVATFLFATAWTILTSPITLVILAIAAVIAIVILLIKYWDDIKLVASNCWEWIKEAWSDAGEWFNNKIVRPIADFFGNLWKGIKTGASLLADFMKQKVIDPIVKLFKGLYNSVILIIEGMINGFIGIINGFIKGINGVIGLINGIPGVDLPTLQVMQKVQIPRLATGTVVPANYGEFAAILGDNKRETEIVSPLSTMKQALIEALQEYGGQNITINFENSSIGDLVRMLKPYIDRENRRVGSSTRVMGGAY